MAKRKNRISMMQRLAQMKSWLADNNDGKLSSRKRKQPEWLLRILSKKN